MRKWSIVAGCLLALTACRTIPAPAPYHLVPGTLAPNRGPDGNSVFLDAPNGLILTGVAYPERFAIPGLSNQRDERERQVPGPGWLLGHGSGSRSSVSALT